MMLSHLTIAALGDEPFWPGSLGGEMKCPTCGENTPDAIGWTPLITSLRYPDAPTDSAVVRMTLAQIAETHLPVPGVFGPETLRFDYMHCANDSCNQLVIRGHRSYRKPDPHAPEWMTETWLVYPRHGVRRPMDPSIPEAMRRDYLDASSILDLSHRMSAVLSRSILADLLETYAGLTKFSLADRIDDFIADESRPHDLRQNLHYLREIADLSAHTKKNDQAEIVEISREEAEWTLDVIDRLFDYFIITPEKDKRLRGAMDAKLADANRKPIKPLPEKK